MTAGIEIVSGFTTAAINTSIAKVVADTGGAGGVVLINPGTYSAPVPITPATKVTLQGGGWQTTKIVASGDNTVLDIAGAGRASLTINNHLHSICVRDMQIDGGSNPAWSTQPMVRMMYADTCEFHKVKFANKYGIQFGILAEVWDSSWWHCRFDGGGGINQGLPAMLVQSGDGTASPGFGFSDDATNDLRFYACVFEAFRDGGYWVKRPANANKVGTNYFYGCKVDTNLTALGTYMSFDNIGGLVLDHLNMSYAGPAAAYAGTPFPLLNFRGTAAVDINNVLHNQAGSGQITAMMRFDGTDNSFPNNYVRLGLTQTNTTSASQYTQSIIRFDGGANHWFDLGVNSFDGMNPTAVAPVYSGTMPSLLPRPVQVKAGAFSDTDFGTQDPGLPGNQAMFVGIDTTNNRAYYRYPDGTYHYSSIT